MTLHIELPTLLELQQCFQIWATTLQQMTWTEYAILSYVIVYIPLSIFMVYLRKKGTYYHQMSTGRFCSHEYKYDRWWLLAAFIFSPLTLFLAILVSGGWLFYQLLLLPGRLVWWPLNLWTNRSVKRGF